uniref:Protein root UVB sensitive/RUS domain-containing protein n=1 Tax=Musa acuminata subsp. malaccensis TaxID=214687 RepID=A0A804I0I0_MUSAM|nr:PREDICTED: protein root UVB sensitive 3 isoform X2 [Musa acuminata subsp. malaccensis]
MEGGNGAPASPSSSPSSSTSTAPSVTVEEWRGSSSTKLSRTAILTADRSHLTLYRSGSRWDDLGRKILEAFIPEGFPGSVTPDYVPFQVWDSLQGLSTYIRSMLSTQALLSAIGVGEKSATVIGATFQWFLRDFTGMLGGILFTFYQGSNLDSSAKMWRLVADFMNDLGMLMDLVSPLWPSAFIVIVCLGSLSRSFTGVAGGATRAALTQHFALQNNAADISAKEGSQETVATMVGMALGMLLAHITMGNPVAIWLSFLSLTMFHIYVLSPREVSRREHIFPVWTTWQRPGNMKPLHHRIHLGVKASTLSHSDMMELSGTASSHYKKVNYLLMERKGVIRVINHKEATSADILRSFFHALILANLTGKAKSLHTESRLWMEEHYHDFIAKLKSAGWATERLLSGSIVWRALWVQSPSEEKIN